MEIILVPEYLNNVLMISKDPEIQYHVILIYTPMVMRPGLVAWMANLK